MSAEGMGHGAGQERNWRLPDGLAQKVVPLAGIVGIGGIVASLGLALAGMVEMERLAHAYLLGFWYFLTICFGALFFVLIHHVVGAKWSIVVRRVAEVITGNFALMGLLAIPIVAVTVMGDSSFFRWADADEVAHNELLQTKQAYLNSTFFAIRVVIYFAIWILLAGYFSRASRAEDQAHDSKRAYRLRQVGAPGLILFGFSLTFAAFDFVMSLEPAWFSTIFGVYNFGAGALAFFCVLALFCLWLEKRGSLPITVEHYHDIGKFMFGFTVFWSYIAFSQYMLIWYANIPEETGFFIHRQAGTWGVMGIVLIFGHFAIPFFGLMSRHIKRRRPLLGFWAVWILVMHFIDLYWFIMPAMHGGAHHRAEHPVMTGIPFHAVDFLCWIGFAGLFVAGIFRRAGTGNLVPVNDPRLEESLAFKNF